MLLTLLVLGAFVLGVSQAVRDASLDVRYWGSSRWRSYLRITAASYAATEDRPESLRGQGLAANFFSVRSIDSGSNDGQFLSGTVACRWATDRVGAALLNKDTADTS
jgi:hypothetical protein